MKMINKSIIALLLAGTLVSALACSKNSHTNTVSLGRVTDYRPSENRVLAKDATAPEFQFTSADGQNLFLSDLHDKVILLNFWSVDCPYCVKEMPLLQQVYKDWQNRGLVILAINTGETETKVSNFMSRRDLTFDIVLDPDVYVSTVYQAMYLPTTYIIDKTGKIVSGKIGAYSSTTEIIAAIEPYLP
jgi:peroxiredoxin